MSVMSSQLSFEFNSFIQLFGKYLLDTSCVPGTVLAAGPLECNARALACWYPWYGAMLRKLALGLHLPRSWCTSSGFLGGVGTRYSGDLYLSINFFSNIAVQIRPTISHQVMRQRVTAESEMVTQTIGLHCISCPSCHWFPTARLFHLSELGHIVQARPTNSAVIGGGGLQSSSPLRKFFPSAFSPELCLVHWQ